jgi:hypothetical protein
MNKRKLDALDNVEENVSKYQKYGLFDLNLPVDCILNILSFLDLKTTVLFRLTCKEMLNVVDEYLLSPIHVPTALGMQVAIENEKIEYVKAHKLNPISIYNDMSRYKRWFIRCVILPNHLFSAKDIFDWLKDSHNYIIVKILTHKMIHRLDLLEKMLSYKKSNEAVDQMVLWIDQFVGLLCESTFSVIHKRILALFDLTFQRKVFDRMYQLNGGPLLVLSYYFRLNIQDQIPGEWLFPMFRGLLISDNERNMIEKFKLLIGMYEFRNVNIPSLLIEIEAGAIGTEEQVLFVEMLIQSKRLNYEDFPELCIQQPELMYMLLGHTNWNPTAMSDDPETDPIIRMVDPEEDIELGGGSMDQILHRLQNHPNWNPSDELLRRHVEAFSKAKGEEESLDNWLIMTPGKYKDAITKYTIEFFDYF